MSFGLEDGSECTGTSCTSLMTSESQNPHKKSVAGPGVMKHAFDPITQQAEASKSMFKDSLNIPNFTLLTAT